MPKKVTKFWRIIHVSSSIARRPELCKKKLLVTILYQTKPNNLNNIIDEDISMLLKTFPYQSIVYPYRLAVPTWSLSWFKSQKNPATHPTSQITSSYKYEGAGIQLPNLNKSC